MRRVVGALVLALSVVGAPAAAAEPGAALLEALARVPDTSAATDQLVSFVDYRAAEAARPGAAQPSSFSQWQALRDAGDPSYGLWMAVWQGIGSGSGDLLRGLLRSGATWPGLLGFDFFDVHSELAFGAPPSDGIVLSGDFDPGAIGRAFTARRYTGSDVVGHTLWCPAAGCESGRSIDFEARNPDNPFGGDLGRNEPMAVSATDLLGSADIATVQGMLDAASRSAPSLAERPAYRAAAEAVEPDVRLIQASMVPGYWLEADVAGLLMGSESPEATKALLEKLASTFEPIPPYELVVIADGATATEQVVSVALVYDRAVDAAVAADVIPRRLETMESLAQGQPLREMLASRGVSSVTGRVVTSSLGDKATAVIVLRAPLASDQPDPDSGRLTASSLVYRMLMEMVYRRDALWLAPTLPVLG